MQQQLYIKALTLSLQVAATYLKVLYALITIKLNAKVSLQHCIIQRIKVTGTMKAESYLDTLDGYCNGMTTLACMTIIKAVLSLQDDLQLADSYFSNAWTIRWHSAL